MITELDFFEEFTDEVETVGHVEGEPVEGEGVNVTDLLTLLVGIMWLWVSRLY